MDEHEDWRDPDLSYPWENWRGSERHPWEEWGDDEGSPPLASSNSYSGSPVVAGCAGATSNGSVSTSFEST